MKKEILILVKTYPEISKKYVETVCVAGIDKATLEMVRIYPIRFRYIDEERQFKKYDWITVDIDGKSAHDNRVESFTINPNSIEIKSRETGGKVDWNKRCKYVLDSPHVISDIKKLKALQKDKNISLAITKPAGKITFFIEKRSNAEITEIEKKKNSVLSQGDLFEDIKDIESIPYRFRAQFKCSHPECPGHNMSILDWEIAQLYRKLKKDRSWKEKMIQKLESICDQNTREVYFILGNINRWRHIFCILGFFYPPRNRQLELF